MGLIDVAGKGETGDGERERKLASERILDNLEVCWRG